MKTYSVVLVWTDSDSGAETYRWAGEAESEDHALNRAFDTCGQDSAAEPALVFEGDVFDKLLWSEN